MVMHQKLKENLTKFYKGKKYIPPDPQEDLGQGILKGEVSLYH
jgi:hypothetical protein